MAPSPDVEDRVLTDRSLNTCTYLTQLRTEKFSGRASTSTKKSRISYHYLGTVQLFR